MNTCNLSIPLTVNCENKVRILT